MEPIITQVLCTSPTCFGATDHEATIDRNGETVLACKVCGSFIKVPNGVNVKDYIALHNEHNTPQVESEKYIAEANEELREMLS